MPTATLISVEAKVGRACKAFGKIPAAETTAGGEVENPAARAGASTSPILFLAGGTRVADIFVFGSNLAGRHGKGAARDALRDYGAVWGCGYGRQGQSYAIPTKDAYLNSLPLERIRYYVRDFLRYARQHPELTFNVTAIGTGYAGYSARQIGGLFGSFRIPPNVNLPDKFVPYVVR